MEQSRPNVFTMNVSNIIPGDTIVVDLKYTELLIPEKGNTHSFIQQSWDRAIPTRMLPTPRRRPVRRIPLYQRGVMPTYKFGYELTINSAIPIQNISCTTHKMDITNYGLMRSVVELDPSETNGGNRDVIVNHSLQGDKIASGMMLYQGKDETIFS